jgi:hopanoid biosynthesis associated protein HpnK
LRRLIVNGDDFGLAEPVNEAIERAHREGILTSASLMVGGDAAADAIERARHQPTLRVGLHVVLVEGRAILPREEIPVLVDERGEFSTDLFAAGVRMFFAPRARRQLAAEIRAQFEAFRRSGLVLDHVNAHNHMHVHPTVLGLILEIGRDYGMNAIRVPYEPALPSWRALRTHPLRRALHALGFGVLAGAMRARLLHERIAANDFVFGLNDSGKMTEEVVLRLVEQLPEGVSEMYFHPATRRCPEIDRTMADYGHEEELAALLSPRVRASVERRGIERIAFGDLAPRAAVAMS